MDLYEDLLRVHIFPAFAAFGLDEITAPRVREWRTERLRATTAKTTVAKVYRLVNAISGEHRRPFGDDKGPAPIRGSGPSAVYAVPYWPLSTG